MAIELINKEKNLDLTAPKITGAVRSVNGLKGDVILTAADVGAVQDTFDSYLYGSGKWMLGINKDGKVQPTMSYSAPTLDGGSIDGFVSYDKAQDLTADQKAQARENISKYKWRTGKYFGMVTFKYADMNNSVNWEIAETMPDVNGYKNTTIVDSMAFICKSIFEGGIGTDFTEEVNAIVNNLNALKEAGAVNGGILFGFPDEEEFLGYAINIASGYSDGRVVISIYKNFMSDSVKTGSWVHYPDGTVTTNISVRNIDATLTKQGFYADAKAVGDAIANIDIPEAEGAVSYNEAQNLTADQKAQARKNIQKYDWREGTFGGVIKIKYCDVSESIDWEVAASMPDALGYNNNIVDYMAQMAKLLFESAPTANNDTMVKNFVTNYKALRDAGGLSNPSITIGYPDNDDNLGFSIQMYAASNDANKITIKIYDNNMHSNVKTGYWIANSDGTVTKSISTINLDTTLAKQGFYADAKAVGDRLAALEANAGGSADSNASDIVLLDMTVEEDVKIIDIPITQDIADAINGADELAFALHLLVPSTNETSANTLSITESVNNGAWDRSEIIKDAKILPSIQESWNAFYDTIIICRLGRDVRHTQFATKPKNNGASGGVQYRYATKTVVGDTLRFAGSHEIGAGSTIKVVAKGVRV